MEEMDLIDCFRVNNCLSSHYLTSIKIIAGILWHNKDLPEDFGLIPQ